MRPVSKIYRRLGRPGHAGVVALGLSIGACSATPQEAQVSPAKLRQLDDGHAGQRLVYVDLRLRLGGGKRRGATIVGARVYEGRAPFHFLRPADDLATLEGPLLAEGL